MMFPTSQGRQFFGTPGPPDVSTANPTSHPEKSCDAHDCSGYLRKLARGALSSSRSDRRVVRMQLIACHSAQVNVFGAVDNAQSPRPTPDLG